jgi:hypothetical protein
MASMQNRINQLEEALKAKNNWVSSVNGPNVKKPQKEDYLGFFQSGDWLSGVITPDENYCSPWS